MSDARRAKLALGALACILAVTVSWWALALWPAGPDVPNWVVRTREACFGSNRDGLPDAGGWLLLVGQPIGMLLVLAAVWPAELRAGFRLLMARAGGQAAVGATAALLVAGVWSAGRAKNPMRALTTIAPIAVLERIPSSTFADRSRSFGLPISFRVLRAPTPRKCPSDGRPP